MFYLRKNLPFPDDLNHVFCQANWGREPNEADFAKLGKSLRSLWDELALRRGFHNGDAHYSFRRDQVDAYASYYLMANALKPALVLEEAFLLGLDLLKTENRWLDFGTGPGTAFWGLAWWCKQRNKKVNFTGWEQSSAFVEKASQLTRSQPFGFSAKFLTSNKTKKDWLDKIETIKPTHISFMNSVAEIFPQEADREPALREILQSLKRLGGERFLLIIEPGSRDSSRELSRLKDSLSEKYQVLLPCFDNRKCGALANPQDWCHEESQCSFPPWMNQLGSAANLRKESLLYSYLLISTADREPLLKEASRMVSQRMERKGQVECHYCTFNGKQKIRVQRSKSTANTEFFFDSCRGDILKNISVGEKGDLIQAEMVKSEHIPTIFKFE